MKSIKKIAVVTLGLLGAIMPISAYAHAANPEVYLNGEYVELEENSIYIEDGNTMVPLRFLAELIDATVEYDAVTQKIVIKKNNKLVELQVDSSKVIIGDEEIELSTKPVIKNHITMVPLRFLSEALDVYVEYDTKHKAIYLGTLQYNVPENIVDGYLLAIDKVYHNDITLNEDAIYIAIDTTRMRYLSEENKQRLLEKMEQYGIVIDATYSELEEQGFIKKGEFSRVILITIDDFQSEGDQLILNINKWRGDLCSSGYSHMLLRKDNEEWKIIEYGMKCLS